MAEVEDFRTAGRTLFSLGLVKGAEGNLSVYGGGELRITRTGSHLDQLGDADILTGGLDDELPEASSDLEVHRRLYLEGGPGAVVHSHPAGTAPEARGGPGRHGLYMFAQTLEEGVALTVTRARELGAPT
jgi:ribulose-5-phosphate 4-epimerase/fuculose-1-phosphate aldolase